MIEVNGPWKLDWLSPDYLLEARRQSIFMLRFLYFQEKRSFEAACGSAGNHRMCPGRDCLEGHPFRRQQNRSQCFLGTLAIHWEG